MTSSGLRPMCVSTHIFPMSELYMNASNLSYVVAQVNWSRESADKAGNGIGNIILSCGQKVFDTYFLTLFYDFLRQSRYADVNERVYVNTRRPQ